MFIMFHFQAVIVCLYFIISLLNFTKIYASVSRNETDRLALMAFKNSIVADPQNVLRSWNDSIHFCDWEGITCGRRHQRVTRISFTSTSLSGKLSPYLGNLSFLRILQINNNSLYGEIPPQLGNLFRLRGLNFFLNNLKGEIPANISSCTMLEHLRVGRNNLVGKLPEELGVLSKLKSLVIEENSFTGNIPTFIGNFTSLEILYSRRNRFSGSLPDVFSHLKKLSILGLATNNFSGMIPPSLYNLSSLTQLSLDQNQFHGSLDHTIDLMFKHLQIIQLSDNQFYGSLPSSLSNCSELERLQVDSNSFDGKIAIDFEGQKSISNIILSGNNFGSGEVDLNFLGSLVNCSNLQELDLSYNKLGGLIPESIGNLSTQLRFLNFESNQINGRLPSTIGNLVNLDTLGFASNHFTGIIPSTIGDLVRLQMLAFEQNTFSGKIPDSIGNLSLLTKFYMGMNRLEGTIPTTLSNCTNLIFLDLSHNNLTGLIPKQLFDISTLAIALNLSQNYFRGSLPFDVGNLKHLGSLDLSKNNLSGEIPSSLGSLSSLENLFLHKNNFQGSIPSSLSSLKGVTTIDLSYNNLSGEIPRFFQELSMRYLNLAFNMFEGEVPSRGVFANQSAISVVGNNNLCGGILELQLPKCSSRKSKKQNGISHSRIILIPIICIILLVTLMIFAFFLWHIKIRKVKSSGSTSEGVRVSYGMLLQATDGFSSERLIGTGRFASVYKGFLDVAKLVVAVKVLNLQVQHSSKSFMKECQALKNARHRNLVKIITCCSGIDYQGHSFKAIVYDFMHNGSLEQWLYSSQYPQSKNVELKRLELLHRISISIDVACALEYLHHQCENVIIHCDLKPSNILLDEDMVAHVGDFGLAKILFSEIITDHSIQSSSIGLRGTIGYVPPEYGLGSEISTEGDVYSFGILLLEMITGKRPTNIMFNEGLNLHNFASNALPGHVMNIVDPSILKEHEEAMEASQKTNIIEECLISAIKVGVACSLESPQARMSIKDVIHELNLVRNIILSQ